MRMDWVICLVVGITCIACEPDVAGLLEARQDIQNMEWVEKASKNRSLQDSTLGEWKLASSEDKLAITAHWLASTKWSGHLQSPDAFMELKIKAQMLIKGLDDIADDDELGPLKTNEIAATIIVMADDLGPS